MRNIFAEIFENRPADPIEAARRGARPTLRQRFYKQAAVGDRQPGGYPLLLDGKPVRTPAKHLLEAPARAIADKLADEWNAQVEVIDPGGMAMTRLANVVIDAIDAVEAAPQAVADEVAKYLGSDLICYRAAEPQGLVARQAAAWDPVLAWSRDALGARFICVEGIVYAAQPAEALAAARAAIPADPWRLGAVASITTITGSALLALAVAHAQLTPEAAWAAAHVDEDWQMQQWGRDDVVLARRAFRLAEFEAAAAVLALTKT